MMFSLTSVTVQPMDVLILETSNTVIVPLYVRIKKRIMIMSKCLKFHFINLVSVPHKQLCTDKFPLFGFDSWNK